MTVEHPVQPLLARLKMATIGASDLGPVEAWYSQWLGHRLVERGRVPAALAKSWGAPLVADRPYILMQPASAADVYIRAVQVADVPDYKPLTTFGWNSFEIIVDDVYDLNEQLIDSPFEIIGPPRSLGEDLDNIHAMQVIGPSREVLYLTCDTGPRADSILPEPEAPVGRLFVAVVSAAGIWDLHDFYTTRFHIEPSEGRNKTVDILNHALNLPSDARTWMTFVALAQAGNFLQIDGYPAKPREYPSGELPPGNAQVSFSTTHFDELDLSFFSHPFVPDSIAYGGSRTASFRGPAGEIVEIIED